jgi:hypothetical protein
VFSHHASHAFSWLPLSADGNSNGGILGTVFLALSNDIHRGVLGVPGAPYNLLVFRSVDFAAYYDLIAARFPDPVDQVSGVCWACVALGAVCRTSHMSSVARVPMSVECQVRMCFFELLACEHQLWWLSHSPTSLLSLLNQVNLMNLVQTVWERASPGGYCNHLTTGTLGTEKKRFLVHYGLGDAQVSWLGAQFLARTAGASMFANNPPEVDETFFGFELLRSEGTAVGSLIQGWNFGAQPVPQTNTPPTSATDTHECVRRDPRAEAQMARFFEDGYIHDQCGDYGRCEPLQPPVQLSHCPLPDF